MSEGGIKVFFCEDTGFLRAYRRFRCPDGHDTEVDDGRVAKADRRAVGQRWDETITCSCGKTAKVDTAGGQTIFRRTDTGEEIGRPLPPGAVYEWCSKRKGPDGRALMCVCPDGHHWFIDGRASNCTMPTDDVHRCWVRHGRPEDGTLHVDKSGNTCQAGAGSIQTGQWHGHLHQGELRVAP